MKEQIIEAFKFRHACKEFDVTKKISNEDFETILESARLSPSSIGLEPWQVLVVQNPELREELKQFSSGGQKQIPTASHLVLLLAKKSSETRYDSESVKKFMVEVKQFPAEVVMMLLQFYEKFQKDVFKLLENERALFDWASKQTYIQLANMMTVAALLGIDSCPMEGFVPDAINAILKDKMGIDTDKFGISLMVAFGYRKDAPFPKTRQDIDSLVKWF